LSLEKNSVRNKVRYKVWVLCIDKLNCALLVVDLLICSTGKAFHVVEKELSPAEKEEFDEGWKSNAFNRYASDRIPINRTLPDVRLDRLDFKF
jgi:hypothetical protein